MIIIKAHSCNDIEVFWRIIAEKISPKVREEKFCIERPPMKSPGKLGRCGQYLNVLKAIIQAESCLTLNFDEMKQSANVKVVWNHQNLFMFYFKELWRKSIGAEQSVCLGGGGICRPYSWPSVLRSLYDILHTLTFM